MKIEEIKEFISQDNHTRSISLRAIPCGDEKEKKIRVEGVAVTAGILDSYNTMFTRSCLDKNKNRNLVFTSDHIRDFAHLITNEAITSVKDVERKDLGIEGEGTIGSLVFNAEFEEDDNEQMFRAYKKGMVKQHSIEFKERDYNFCFKDGDVHDKANWDKFFTQLEPESRAIADERGWFVAYDDADIMGVSAVLYGSNKLTPTLSARSDKGIIDEVNKKGFFARIK